MAKLHYSNEQLEPVNADHSAMVKFESADRGMYPSVRAKLRAMGDVALDMAAQEGA